MIDRPMKTLRFMGLYGVGMDNFERVISKNNYVKKSHSCCPSGSTPLRLSRFVENRHNEEKEKWVWSVKTVRDSLARMISRSNFTAWSADLTRRPSVNAFALIRSNLTGRNDSSRSLLKKRLKIDTRMTSTIRQEALRTLAGCLRSRVTIEMRRNALILNCHNWKFLVID